MTDIRLTTNDAYSRIGTMFVVDNILISDDVVEASFACNLSACHGACCVQGDSGAPLEKSERQQLEDLLPVVHDRLSPEALDVIGADGVWERTSTGDYATTCIGTSECVFVRYQGPIAMCSIQEVYSEGKTTFEKPISCHLYPLRITDLGEFDALNYEQIDICAPAIKKGVKQRVFLSDYLERPLVRKYGPDWYVRFKEACEERRLIIEETRK